MQSLNICVGRQKRHDFYIFIGLMLTRYWAKLSLPAVLVLLY